MGKIVFKMKNIMIREGKKGLDIWKGSVLDEMIWDLKE